jgi:hypothetical protein
MPASHFFKIFFSVKSVPFVVNAFAESAAQPIG